MKTNPKGFAPIVIALAVISFLAVSGVAAWYFYQTAQPKLVPVGSQKSIQPTTAAKPNLPTQPTIVTDTSNWQTYRNDEFGFEFKYPLTFKKCDINTSDISDWKEIFKLVGFDQDCNGGNNEYINNPTDVIIISEQTAIEKEYSDINSLKMALEKKINDGYGFIVGGTSLYLVNYVEEKNINGIQMIKVGIQSFNLTETDDIYYYFGNNKLFGFLYNLAYSNAQDQGIKAEENIDQIFSTFKFIEPNDAKCAEFFNQPTGQNNTVDLPVSCELAIGKNFNNWRFNIISGQTSADLPDARFQFEIQDEGGKIIQKIPVGDKDYSPNAYEITSTSGDDINFANDINFDGYKDLRVLKFLAASNIMYDYWIFDPNSKKFEKDSVLTDVPNASFNAGKKTIEGYVASGPDPANWTNVTYQFINGAYKKIGTE